MAKRLSARTFFLNLMIEKTNPQNESHSDCEETVAAKKGRKFSLSGSSPGSGNRQAGGRRTEEERGVSFDRLFYTSCR
ncbi:hypothetical protein EYF80_005297 [Liparis tanakae]|uniref:Uncharacterized protein n=1 Tax=Liparis tanakae TaxID=230148 RepID=A0A4Z2J3K3_9TELE|nr:hypothetical protein EYF80_005297 [Liparis tanakae]